MGLLLIEQNLGVATSLAERQLVMVAGEIATETTAAAHRGRPGRAAALPRRHPRGGGVVPTVVLVGHARHEGPRVRVPARPAARARCRRPARRRGRGRAARRAGPRGCRAPHVRRSRRRRRGDGARRRGDRAAGCTRRAASTAILALGGSGGTAIATQAMRALPVGVPKLMVSTMASGDTRPYVGAVDVTMTYSVVDIAGINEVSARILANAAAAIAGMAKAGAAGSRARRQAARRRDDVRRHDAVRDARARAARGARLRGARLPRHRDGWAVAWRRSCAPASSPRVLDVTTTELADDLVGGVLSAGPGPARGGGRARAAAGRLAGRARHGQLRAARHGARALPRPPPLRAQPDRHAHAHDARGVRRARPPDRAQAERGDGPGHALRPAARRLDDRRRGAAVPRSGGRRGARPRAARGARRRPSTCASSTRTSTTPPSPAAMADRLHELAGVRV